MIKQEISKLRKKITALEAEETILSVKIKDLSSRPELLMQKQAFKQVFNKEKFLMSLRKETEEQKVRLKYLENR